MSPPSVTALIHFSDRRYRSDDLRAYYFRRYAEMPGYVLPDHWFELPVWMAYVKGMVGGEAEVIVVPPEEEGGIRKAASVIPKEATVLVSVMDVNRSDALAFAAALPNKVLMGGYVNLDDLRADAPANVEVLENLDDLRHHYDEVTPYDLSDPDYSIFKAERCIPRLTMSEGCPFSCDFCTIPTTKPIPRDAENIWRQADSFRPLDFDLVYLDDKLFGASQNWSRLGEVRDQILRYNKGFQGFIVQTTVTELLRKGFERSRMKIHEAAAMGVRYIEVGLEAVDDDALKAMKKPHRTKHLDLLAAAVREEGVKLIPNVMLCIPDVDYTRTVAWLRENLDIVPMVNLFHLSTYAHSKGRDGSWLPKYKQPSDADELSFERSWLTPEAVLHNVRTQEEIYSLWQK